MYTGLFFSFFCVYEHFLVVDDALVYSNDYNRARFIFRLIWRRKKRRKKLVIQKKLERAG